MKKDVIKLGLSIFIIIAAAIGKDLYAQPKLEFQIKKPKQFEERQLGSEKMAEKKFTPIRHFFQNMYTHYNYYYNANNLLDSIISIAKKQHKEDFTQLLPFYNYSLDITAKISDIDSVIQKCTAGILLHDLRNDWIDNLYLLLGRAYLIRKNFDSAYMTFQYINYSYSPKEKDGYDKVIGSNSNSNEGGSILSVATKENMNFYKKLVELPPSRNEALVWQIRTYTEKKEYIDAASLITTLKNDPIFPTRLKPMLAEAEAYNYYKQAIYDSAAKYLSDALDMAGNRTEKSRRYYLIGQLYELSNQPQSAAYYFAKCAKTAIEPVMEIYARLRSVHLQKNDNPQEAQQNIDEIVKMAKREKYFPYRDIIFYAAALSELERANYDKAETYINKSIFYNKENIEQRSKSFLLLTEMAFNRKAYGKAGKYYDSINTRLFTDTMLVKKINARKPGCKTIYQQERVIFAQDSLLKVAAMPENDRNAYIKTLVRHLRKERGMQAYMDSANTGLSVNATQIGKGPDNLFNSNQGEFYFYNASLRSAGYQQFKQKWGSRQNADNWRRSSAIKGSYAGNNANTATSSNNTAPGIDVSNIYQPTDITPQALTKNIPLDNAQKDAANQTINGALLQKGKALQNDIEDTPEAIKVFEELLSRINAQYADIEELLFCLSYCYGKTGDKAKADLLKKRLNNDYPNGAFTKRINMPALGNERANPAATTKYKEIYNLFIEGSFEKAVQEKKVADSIFGTMYWTPQLLYIESVFYIKQRSDSVAIQKLNAIVSTFPTSPLVARAKTLVNVLGRRKEIEEYLTKLQITRYKDDPFVLTQAVEEAVTTTPKITVPPVKDSASSYTDIERTASNLKKAPVNTPATTNNNKTTIDGAKTPVSIGKTPAINQRPQLPNLPFKVDTAAPQMVGIVLHKVDVVYFNECLNAFSRYNQQHLYNQKFELQKQKLNNEYSLIIINSPDFTSADKALEYLSKIKPKAATHIIPWLDADKFIFIIISQANLELLQQNPDIPGYLKSLKMTLPEKF